MKTKVTKEQLRLSVQVLGGNADDSSHQIVAAMVMDADFRERVTRMMFNRALDGINE
jgi:hypothetical protein